MSLLHSSASAATRTRIRALNAAVGMGMLLITASIAVQHPAKAQTYPGVIGIEASCGGSGPFVDLAKTLRPFSVIGTGGNTPTDANGWPTTDGETVLMDERPLPAWAPPIDDPAGYQPDMSGVYNCSFTGQATLGTSGGSVITFANQAYNSGTNTTTFTFTVPSGTWQTAPALVVIDFTNTKRTSGSATNTGITNLVCIRPGYPAGSTQIFTNQFANAFAPFGYVRYKDWVATDHNPGYYGDSGHHLINWSDRGLPSDASQGNTALHPGAHGNAWEYTILLANQLNKDAWISIPVEATGYNTTDTTSYIYQLALLFKNGDAFTGGVGLKPGLHLYLEHSNEVWNFSYGQYTWNKLEAVDAVAGTGSLGTTHVNSDGSTDQEIWAHRRHAERLYQIAQIFATVFGAGSMNTTIRPVYASWFIYSQAYFSDVLTWMNTQYGAPSNYFYAMAAAAYAGETPVAGESVATILANMTTASNTNLTETKSLRTVANNFGLKLYGYEGGPDNGGGSTTNVGNRILANRDPGMTTLIEHDIRTNWFGQGLADSFGYYSLSGGYSRYGCYGVSEDISNTSISSPKWAAIYNLTGYTPGSPPAAPTGFTATPGNTQVALNWTVSAGATSYNIYRSTTAGGEGTTPIVSGITTTTYTNTGLTNGTVYYYKVAGLNGNGTGAQSSEASATPSASAPPVPTGLTATPGNTQVALSWNAATGATAYDVKRSTVSGSGYVTVSSPATTSYTNTGLTNGTVYYFVVDAKNASGTSANSAQVSATPALSIISAISETLPSTPGVIQHNLQVGGTIYSDRTYTYNAISSGAVNLTGDDYIQTACSNKSVSGYSITYTLGQTATVYVLSDSRNTTLPSGMAAFSDTGVTLTETNATTTFKVYSATQVAGNYTLGAQVSGNAFYTIAAKAGGISPPPAPTNLTATPGNGQVVLNWTASTGATSYTVNFTTGGNYTAAGTTASTTFTHTGLTNGTLYTYYVTAANAGGTSGASNNASATPTGIPAVPTGLTATAGNTQVALSWTASAGATAYDVKGSTVSGSGYVTVSSPTVTNYTNTGLTNGTIYYFVVDAKNASGTSANSAQVSATPYRVAIAHATTAPVIDGTVDAIWSSATTYTLANNVDGTAVPAADISGTVKAMWDTTNLYVLYQVTDDVKMNDSVNPWDDDAVEVFIDGNYSHGTAYDGVDDVQYVFGWGDAVFSTQGITGHTAGITFAKSDPTGTTYVIEIKIPWSTIGGTAAAGRVIGFDGHIDDDDNGGIRDNALAYSDTTNVDWTNPSAFAAAELR